MGFIEKNDNIYAYIIDGDIRVLSNENNPKAVKREFENPTTKLKGVKYEIVMGGIKGVIKNVFFKETNFGESLYVVFKKEKEGDKDISLQLSLESSYAEDLMLKLPKIDFSKEVSISSFSFTNDKGKLKRGITVYQMPDGVEAGHAKEKITSFFNDKENKKKINGYPEVEGDVKKYGKSDWKIYFLTVRKFLVDYTKKNICPKFSGEDYQLEAPVVVESNHKEDDGEIGEINVNDIFPDTPEKKEIDPVLEKLEQISILAKAKLGAITDAEVPQKVMESTGLAYIVVNYDKILDALIALK